MVSSSALSPLSPHLVPCFVPPLHCFHLVPQIGGPTLFREWINIARQHFLIPFHNQLPLLTTSFRFRFFFWWWRFQPFFQWWLILFLKSLCPLFREWINIGIQKFILFHNQPWPSTTLCRFRFSCSGGDFILSSGGGLGGLFHDACMSSSSPSCGGGGFSLSSGGGLGGIFCDACSLSSGGGLGGIFHDACSLSSSGGLGGLFHDACTSSSSPCHSTDSSENGSILNSNMSSSSTILCHLELDPLG